MAVPVTPDDSTEANFINAQRNKVFFDGTNATGLAAVGNPVNLAGLKHTAYGVTASTTGQGFSLPRGVVAAAWQANAVTEEASCSVAATEITLTEQNTSADGWIHVLSRGTENLTGTNDITPIARGTAGYCQPGSMYLCPRSATPNAKTVANVARTANLRLRIFPFFEIDTGDTWATTTLGYMSGIAAVAWQSDDTDNECAATLNAAGNVLFTSDSANITGYLWAWTRG